MASRRFYGYDPYDYTYPYYHHQPAPAGGDRRVFRDADRYYSYQHEPAIPRNAGGFFPVTGDFDPYYHPSPSCSAGGFFPAAGNVEPSAPRAAVRPKAGSSRSVSVPVRFVGSDTDSDIEIVATVPVKRPPSAQDAAVRVQAAGRGFLARRAVRALRALEREADDVAEKVERDAEALRGDARARIAVGEALMRLLLQLDAVRGAREYRRRVTKRVLALQDAVDAFGQRSAAAAEEAEDEAVKSTTGETVAEENAVATELPGAVEKNGVAETVVAMDVDGNRAAAEDAEPASDGTDLGIDKPEEEDAESEWEMVSGEPAAAVPADPQTPQTQEPALAETTTRPAVAGTADGGMDTKKLMEMVAALCEQSAQQCAVIGVLAQRVDALERAVGRVESAERRRRRAKKLREGKGSSHIKCLSD